MVGQGGFPSEHEEAILEIRVHVDPSSVMVIGLVYVIGNVSLENDLLFISSFYIKPTVVIFLIFACYFPYLK